MQEAPPAAGAVAQLLQHIHHLVHQPGGRGSAGQHAHGLTSREAAQVQLCRRLQVLHGLAVLPGQLCQVLGVAGGLAAHHDHRVHRAGQALGLLLPGPGVFADGVLEDRIASPAAQVVADLVVVLHRKGGLGHHQHLLELVLREGRGLGQVGDDLAAALRKAAVGHALSVPVGTQDHREVALGAPLLDLVVDLGHLGTSGVDDLQLAPGLALLEAPQVLDGDAVGADHHRAVPHHRGRLGHGHAPLADEVQGLGVVDERPQRLHRTPIVAHRRLQHRIHGALDAPAEACGLGDDHLHGVPGIPTCLVR